MAELAKFIHGSAKDDKFDFIKSWNKLSHEEKLEKYNEYNSHEINFFLYMRDKEFFNSVAKQFLLNKFEKKLIDLFLVGEYDLALELYNNNERFEESNAFEICLIILMLVN